MLTFLLAAFGIVTIVTKSSLFDPVRVFAARRVKPLAPLVTCTMCNGFWIGVGLALLDLGPHVARARWLDAFIAGCIASGVCWASHVALGALLAPRDP